MADGRPAGVFLHQAFVLAAMVEPEDFADAAQFLVGVDQLVAVRVEGRHARPKAGRDSGYPAASAASAARLRPGPARGTSGLTPRPGRW